MPSHWIVSQTWDTQDGPFFTYKLFSHILCLTLPPLPDHLWLFLCAPAVCAADYGDPYYVALRTSRNLRDEAQSAAEMQVCVRLHAHQHFASCIYTLHTDIYVCVQGHPNVCGCVC